MHIFLLLWGLLYWQKNISEISDFIEDVIKYVSPVGVPYEIKTSPSVLISNMTVFGDNRVIHLINKSGSNPPVENVAINFKIPSGKKILNIRSFTPTGLTQKKVKNILNITIPRIEKYQGIVIEMG